MELNSTSVDAGQAGAESQPTATTEATPDTGAKAAPAEQQPVKQPQSKEENAAYAKMRRQLEAAEQRMNDIVQWGWDGKFKSVDELEAARRDAEMQQAFSENPAAAVKKAVAEQIEQHPIIAATKAERLELAFEKEAITASKELPDLNIKTGADLRAIVEGDPELEALVFDKGIPPLRAYKLLHHDELVAAAATKAERATIEKLSANATATPGALGQAADAPLTISEAELKHPDQARAQRDPAYFNALKEAWAKRNK